MPAGAAPGSQQGSPSGPGGHKGPAGEACGATARGATAAAHANVCARALWAARLVGVERSAKEYVAQCFGTATAPLSLESLLLAPGDVILATVTLGYGVRTLEWEATVRSSREVTWAAMPALDEAQWGGPSAGKVRFVLTHMGHRLYDEDNDLYYPWRRRGAAAGAAAGHLRAEVGAAEAGADALAAAAPAPSVLRARLVAALARGVVLAVAAALALCLYGLARALLTHVLLPMSRSPLRALGGVLAVLPAAAALYVAARVAYRWATEPEAGGEEEEEEEEGDEPLEAERAGGI